MIAIASMEGVLPYEIERSSVLILKRPYISSSVRFVCQSKVIIFIYTLWDKNIAVWAIESSHCDKSNREKSQSVRGDNVIIGER